MENIVKVFVANVPTDIPYKEKIVNLSNDAKQRLNNSTNNFERNKIILQERLLRYGLNQMSAQLPEILEIHRTKYGKPYLTNVGGLYFNISHSGNLIAMAIARCPVGIDIEIGKNADVEVAYSFFHDVFLSDPLSKFQSVIYSIKKTVKSVSNCLKSLLFVAKCLIYTPFRGFKC